jgi:hypothetical protein
MRLRGFPTANKVPKVKWRDTANRWDMDDLFNIADEEEVGIVPGEHDCVVIDCDIDGSGARNLERKFGKIFGSTFHYRTRSGGGHIWYSLPDDIHIPQRTRILPGVDIRNRDGYVCIRREYNLRNKEAIKVCPVEVLGWLLETPRGVLSTRQKPPDGSERPLGCKVRYCVEPIPVGRRNDVLFRQACGLLAAVKRKELLPQDMQAILDIRARNSGVSFQELELIIKSAMEVQFDTRHREG